MQEKKYNLDILFLGGVFREEDIMKESKSNVQFAANVLQWNIIEGLDQLNAQPVQLLNAIFIGSYPKYYKKAYIQRREWSHSFGTNNDIDVDFWNLPLFKKFSRGWSLSKEITNWAKKTDDRKKAIIAYSMDYSLLRAIKVAKEENPAIKTCLIVPDLPQFMNLSSSRKLSYEMLKNIECNWIERLQQFIDSYVLLTKHMANSINLQNKPYTVVEGMVNINDQILSSSTNELVENNIKTILYTGTLNKKYGILDLLEAFLLIDKENYVLQICGTGEAEKEILALANHDTRIDFRGRVSRNEALKLQRKATVLINPRNSEGEFTKYSFPSKIMEYLVAGVPTIAYKLPGMPDEYTDYLYIIEENSVNNLADTLVDICEKESLELKNFGEAARKFVLTEKNNVKQVGEILKML